MEGQLPPHHFDEMYDEDDDQVKDEEEEQAGPPLGQPEEVTQPSQQGRETRPVAGPVPHPNVQPRPFAVNRLNNGPPVGLMQHKDTVAMLVSLLRNYDYWLLAHQPLYQLLPTHSCSQTRLLLCMAGLSTKLMWVAVADCCLLLKLSPTPGLPIDCCCLLSTKLERCLSTKGGYRTAHRRYPLPCHCCLLFVLCPQTRVLPLRCRRLPNGSCFLVVLAQGFNMLSPVHSEVLSP
jgi:hypothetical protein